MTELISDAVEKTVLVAVVRTVIMLTKVDVDVGEPAAGATACDAVVDELVVVAAGEVTPMQEQADEKRCDPEQADA